ncbi:MAG: hypothetical protein LBV43_08205 [Prevotella sp.]|jgi:hypothetical protein|nr:hypothetical protein [Prevotella sp.]
MQEKQTKERGYLPLRILAQPLDLPIELTMDYDKRSAIRSIDDEKMVLELSTFSWIEFIAWTACFLLLFFPVDKDLFECIVTYTAQLILFILMLSCIIKYKKQIVLNRKEGTITYPKFFLPIPETIPFNEAKFITGFTGVQGENFSNLRLRRKDGTSWVTFNTSNILYYTYIWYMDRNRPLPPGSAFDEYRLRDYERRKKEEFPPPLYQSYINTPDIDDEPDRYNKYTINNPEIIDLYTQIIGR